MRLRRCRPVIVVCCLAGMVPLGACAPSFPAQSAGLPDVATVRTTAPLPVDTEFPEVTQDASGTPTEDQGSGTWLTKWGPLSEADRSLIQKVRLATLWEMTIAQEAVQKASTAKVREISKEIASQHHDLDVEARDLATKLNVELPVRPTDDQQNWMSDISGRTGIAYDTTYVKWLRLAHGQIFGLIGTVRGSTQNTLVRKFSEQCNAAVLNHQRLLESTGLTTPESFPTPST
ncbi:DUF4142 domain-containing protein [Nonomuraea longispora]|uniref:DUF4142 domain-containing protein n=1 Tax=Nonomuraea longispora TaxID=1848320 RepID=A0A4R4NEX7_9ACTN|nr:DUF4142 domain-containing protein [Nonomuraea longispora]TDC07748.1 DUF4142 domain-containing protein [Nonomuraea longispora]